MPSCLVLTAAPVATQTDLTTLLAAQGLSDAAPLSLATSSGALAAGALPAAAFDAVVSVAQAPGHHTVALLGLLGAALKPGGKLVVQEVGGMGHRQRHARCTAIVLMSQTSKPGGCPHPQQCTCQRNASCRPLPIPCSPAPQPRRCRRRCC